MNLVQSIWTKPLENRWDVNEQLGKTLWCYAYSVHTLKKYLPNCKITLYTDELGMKTFGKLPYDFVKCELDKINHIPTNFWAYGKIFSMKNEPAGSIHIDGDIFIKNSELSELLKFNKSDIIVQSTENTGDTEESWYIRLFEHFKNIKGFRDYYRYAYNTGIFGFKEKDILEQYINIFEEQMATLIANKTTADVNIVLEQYNLYQYTEDNGLRVKKVIPDNVVFNSGLQSYVNHIGYVHALGKYKYSDEFQNKFKTNLKKENAWLYKTILGLLKYN